ncbi:MAG TPA: 2-amino-4-hydroxy-6-hydroxymethyldihydropteridine diphosphokinase [Anaerolineales bacterium]
MTLIHPSIIYLALGSNLGNRSDNLQAAIAAMPPAVRVLALSPVYETPPWGLNDQPAFLNMALKGETTLAPVELLKFLKLLETKLGRQPAVRWGPRRIDMDILFYADLVFDSPELVLPHPRLHERAFVLAPLADLAPDFVHPVLGKPVRDLLSALDSTGVNPYEPID